ncbi:STAS-like domain-containing protein [Shewanella algae]|uniref:STAS-like domain-containing protein n=1 Tax=Shewanella algae TaxID=38313 RepID=UPI00313D890A
MKSILVKEIVGYNAISMNSGNKLKELILESWNGNERIELNFIEVEVFASPFFNASIGVLLKDKKIEDLQGKLVFSNISEHGKKLLNLVISNAIKFYSDTEGKTTQGLSEIRKDL